MKEGFRPIADFPGYFISGKGRIRVINANGYELPRRGRKVRLRRKGQTMAVALYALWAAAWPEMLPAPEAEQAKPVAAKKQEAAPRLRLGSPRPSRRCHDCGKATSNYRCPRCWSKLRGGRASGKDKLPAVSPFDFVVGE